MTLAIALDAIFLLLWGFQVQRYLLQSKEVNHSRLEKTCFLIGATTWLICVCDPLAKLSGANLSVHMMSQLAIMMVAVPLVLIGKPKLLMPQLKSSNALASDIAVFAKKVFQYPIFSWIVFVSVLIAIHLPAIVNWTYGNSIGPRLIQALLLPAISALYFYPILQVEKRNFSFALRIMSLFFMMIPETMIGFFIYIQNHIVYSGFLFGKDVEYLLGQQQLAGALMWSMSMIVDSIWIALAVQRWFESEKLAGERINAEIFAENAAQDLRNN
jgi:cytochrome c oxidase assembly factor CtaG